MGNQSTDYREALEDAARALHKAEIKLFTAMVNVGFTGPYDDLSKLHEEGEVLDLEIAMFEDTGDANLDALVDIVKEVAWTRQQIISLNALTIDLDEEDSESGEG